MARDEPKVNIRLSQDLKDQLHTLATKNKRSVNAEVIAAIEEALLRDKMDDETMLGTGGLTISSHKFFTPRAVLEEVAKMAAREALEMERVNEKKGKS
ncbi:Arc family DNA-binding protein [Pectobacterium polaris]|uniref:Arc family DNA-binding protein n=1 Tax=Pectobacterium polaris TaxID=2042057 RepID=UPI0032E3FF00